MAWTRIAAVADVPEGSGKAFTAGGQRIAVFCAGGAFYAIDDTCSHAQASLSEGELDTDELCVECPLHGSPFHLETGQPRTLPAYAPVRTYAVRVEGDDLLVEL